MSQTSSFSFFPSLFDVALQNYAKETGTALDDHPLAKELQTCDSVDSISFVLQTQAQKFHAFRGEDGKFMKSLKSVVHVLYHLSNRNAIGEGVGMVCPKALIAIFSWVSDVYFVAMDTCKGSIFCCRCIARRMYLSSSRIYSPVTCEYLRL